MFVVGVLGDRHVLREANGMADQLMKDGCERLGGFFLILCIVCWLVFVCSSRIILHNFYGIVVYVCGFVAGEGCVCWYCVECWWIRSCWCDLIDVAILLVCCCVEFLFVGLGVFCNVWGGLWNLKFNLQHLWLCIILRSVVGLRLA